MITTSNSGLELVPNREFTKLASEEQIARTVQALEANNMHTIVAESGAEAKKIVLELVPEGAEVYTNQSKTLERLGLFDEFDQSGRYQAVRQRVMGLDRKTQSDEIRKLRSGPDTIIGSIQAITEKGQVLSASFGGSQLGAYVYGSRRVIWVVGTQKLVKDLDEGLRRIQEYCYPLEDARLLAALGIHSGINKTLIIDREAVAGRVTIVLVKEELGF
jgi:hypothetical protein